MDDFANGRKAGEDWARETGTTEEDLRMVPDVKGSKDYKAGFRVGVSVVRRERHLAENA